MVARNARRFVTVASVLTALSLGFGCQTRSSEPSSGPRSPEAPKPDDADATPSDAQLEKARSLAKGYMSKLKGELQRALKEKGAPGAIDVCSEAAPGIAGQLSQDEGWAVGRTALRIRNPRNAPSVRERAVLMRFVARAKDGESLAEMEEAAILGAGEDRYLHYMKAIPTGGVCLTCHGNQVAPEVEKAILARYPADAATGFEAGELRGAFTFVKPLNES